MTFKTNAVKRTITGTFQKPNGTPAEGKLFIKLSRPVLGREENVVYTTQRVEVVLDAAGSFSEDFAVTAPGLTTDEEAALATVIANKNQVMLDIAEVQNDLNAYLLKLQSGATVTQTETDTYNTNVEQKKTLQSELSDLTTEELAMKRFQETLKKQASIVRILCDFKNPNEKQKMNLILEPGTDAIDIADIPPED